MARKIDYSRIEGRVGNMVFYQYNGKQCVRTIAANYNDAKSPAQLLQRAKMRAAIQWAKPLLEVNRLGFVDVGRGRCFRRAVSLVMNEAMEEEGGVPYIVPAKALVAHGVLKPMLNGHLADSPQSTGHSLTITWTPNAKTSRSNFDDQLVWVLYDLEARRVVSNVEMAPRPQRRQGQCSIALDDLPSGIYQCYAFFVDADASKSSNSVHLGVVTR